MSTKAIYNLTENAVQESLSGYLLLRKDLKLLRRTSNVLIRADIETYRSHYVTILCGGGSGHEPAHAGYIGDGMLSCAVLGNVFASPSVESIYRAIIACASPKGVLVIVKNYTGDRLNFGMAVEKAKANGVSVRMVIVGDDCTVLSRGSITGRRGVAGTLFVQKVAGSRAFHDKATLDEVASIAEDTAKNIRTLGIGLTSCSLPGQAKTNRLSSTQMEVGIGIHGEPGRSVQDIPSMGLADGMARIISSALLEDYKYSKGGDSSVVAEESLGHVAVMVNNLGTTPDLEINAFTSALLPELHRCGAIIDRLFVGTFMTALDMHGVSVTLLSLTTDVMQCLDSPTSAPAWRRSCDLHVVTSDVTTDNALDGHNDSVSIESTIFPQNIYLSNMCIAICNALIAAEPLLNELDRKCGDGDCGETVKSAASQLLATLTHIPADMNPRVAMDLSLPWNVMYANTCRYIADQVSTSMGGTLGAITELLFRAMANFYSSIDCAVTPPLNHYVSALEEGIGAITFYGGATVGMRTMLDALYPAVMELKSGGSWSTAAVAADQGAISTRTMTGLAGRSSYVNPDALLGVSDPGATAVAIVLKVVAESDL